MTTNRKVALTPAAIAKLKKVSTATLTRGKAFQAAFAKYRTSEMSNVM